MPRPSPFMMSRPTLFLFLLCLLGMPALRLEGAAGATAAPRLALTAGERAWIAAHPVIRVGHDAHYAPYSMSTPDGGMEGLDVSYVALLARYTGLRFENETRATWTGVIDAFEHREIDLVMGVARTPEREAFTLFTDAYYSAPNVIVTRDDQPFIPHLGQLDGRRVGVPAGYVGLIASVRRSASRAVIIQFNSLDQALRAVAAGEVDAVFADLTAAAYSVKALHLGNLKLSGLDNNPGGVLIGVRRDWPELVGILNKALAAVTREDRRAIDEKWIRIPYEEDRWWSRAFRIAVVAGFVVAGFLLLLAWHNRRLARELAERRRVQRELEEARDHLAAIGEAKSQILNMVVHDLRSPLTTIQLGADFIRTLDEDTTLPVQQAAESIRSSARQMIRLINDLLAVHKLEAGRLELTFGPVAVTEVLHQSVQLFSLVAAHKRIKIEVTAPSRLEVVSDAVALRQVVDNLLSNAIKYSRPDTRVFFTAAVQGEHCRLAVRDQGPGVKRAEIAQLFTQYGRGSAQPTAGEVSTGLGLWIVRRLVTGLHGRVWCESVEGQGATFLVELPLRPPVVVAAGPAVITPG